MTTNRLRWMAASVKAVEKKRQDEEQLRQYRQEEAVSQRAGLVSALDAQVADAEAQQSSTALSPRIDAIERGLTDPGIPDEARARLTPRIEVLRAKLSKFRADEVATLERNRAAREARAAQDNEELARLEKANRERADALADERVRRAKLDEERRRARQLEASQDRSSPAHNEAVATADRQETTEEMMDRISGRSRASRQASAQGQGVARPGLDTGLLREICPSFAAGYATYEQTERRLVDEGRRSSNLSPSEKVTNRTDFCRPYATKMSLFQAMRRDLASCDRLGADPAIGSGLARLDDSIAGWSQTTASAGCAQ